VVWENEFQHRMRRFNAFSSNGNQGQPMSIKVRITSGCYHREHSPHAYKLIDDFLRSSLPPTEPFSFEEHESGPEILVYLAVAAGVISLSNSLVDLITNIIKARSEGIRQGDSPCDPIELIVRRFDESGNLEEEKVLRFNASDAVDKEDIERGLKEAAQKIIPKRTKNMSQNKNSSTRKRSR
jgi:hypothetical protein